MSLLEKIYQYQKADEEGKLFKSDDVKAEAREIYNTYITAFQQGYKPTQQDINLLGTVQVFIQPDLVDKIQRRMNSNPKDGVKPSNVGIEGLDD